MNLEDDFEEPTWRRLGTEADQDDLYDTDMRSPDPDIILIGDSASAVIDLDHHDGAIHVAREKRMKARMGIEGDLYIASVNSEFPANRNRPGFGDPYDLDDAPVRSVGAQGREALIEAVAEEDDAFWESQLAARLRHTVASTVADESYGDVRFGKDGAMGYKPAVPIPSFSEAHTLFMSRAESHLADQQRKELDRNKANEEKTRLTNELGLITEALRVAKEELARLERI
jgi:hypothetical protein